MQNKKTAKTNIDVSDLPDISAENQIFARELACGRSASDALRTSRDCSKMQPNTLWSYASRLASDPKVRAWISAYRQAGIDRAVLDREQYIRMHLSLHDEAKQAGNFGASVQALKHAGDAMGHHNHIERLEITSDHMDTLAELARISPKVAAALAEENGIAWGHDHGNSDERGSVN